MRQSWTKETALKELRGLLEAAATLVEERALSANHTRWVARSLAILEEVFGRESWYYLSFAALSWRAEGRFIVGGPADPEGAFDPQAAIARRDHQAYLEQLGTARGLLLAAADQLERTDLDQMHEGKDMPPEGSARMTRTPSAFEFDVVLSFAGEDREKADALAELLDTEQIRVFYDKWERAELWGRDLAQRLDEVYRKKGQYCVIFISEHYAEKVWPRHELRSALARAVEEAEPYILPVRLDDTDLPGLAPTLAYEDLRKTTVEEIAELVAEKVRGAGLRAPGEAPEGEAASGAPDQPSAARAAIEASGAEDIRFREVELTLSRTWDRFLAWLAEDTEGATVDSIRESEGMPGSFHSSGKPGSLSYPVVVCAHRHGMPLERRVDLVAEWLHPIAVESAGPSAGVAWDTWLFPVNDEAGDEVRISDAVTDCRDCVYSVLFAAPEEANP